jgi:hypothetical protein
VSPAACWFTRRTRRGSVTVFLTGDDPAQATKARELIEGGDLFVPTSVLLETEWVLRSGYGFAPERLVRALRNFAGLPGVTLEDPGLAARALDWAEQGSTSPTPPPRGCPGCTAFMSFDRRLGKAAAGVEECGWRRLSCPAAGRARRRAQRARQGRARDCRLNPSRTRRASRIPEPKVNGRRKLAPQIRRWSSGYSPRRDERGDKNTLRSSLHPVFGMHRDMVLRALHPSARPWGRQRGQADNIGRPSRLGSASTSRCRPA